jgi:hypothetical protein
MASKTALYAFAADGEVYPCQNPNNTALCQALLDKSETYPDEARDKYRRRAYRDAAETVTVLSQDIPAVCKTLDTTRISAEVCRYFGDRTTQFILDFCHKTPEPAPAAPSLYQKMYQLGPEVNPTCAHKDNQPVWQALIEKAASYPPEKKYNARAYLLAASDVLDLDYSLAEIDWVGRFDPLEDKMTYFGPKTYQFIKDFFINKSDAGAVKCLQNLRVYQAIKKAIFITPTCRGPLAATIADLTYPLTKENVAAVLQYFSPFIRGGVAAILP